MCWLQFGDIAVLPRVADRPLLSSARPAALTDLCGFFVTVNAAVTDGSGTVSHTSHTSTGRLTAGTPSQSHTLSRARSAPNVSLIDSSHSSAVWASTQLKDDSVLSPMEYIEKLILTDFLEPMPQN